MAEALASGCLVAGYDGGGGHELFEAPGTWRVPEQRPLLLRDRVADLLERAPELAEIRTGNRAWVLDAHHRSATARALAAAVGRARQREGADALATHPAAWLDVLGAGFTAYA